LTVAYHLDHLGMVAGKVDPVVLLSIPNIEVLEYIGRRIVAGNRTLEIT
jgi:hypothetical protein